MSEIYKELLIFNNNKKKTSNLTKIDRTLE